MKKDQKNGDTIFLDGGGEMGNIIRTMDWQKFALGDIGNWPTSLRTIVGIILHSDLPMFLFWGKELSCFYNDAFKPNLDADGKHPGIGKNGKEVWPEIWELIAPSIQNIYNSPQPVSFHDRLIHDNRNGKSGETYWSYHCSPVHDDTGKVNGILITCTETKEAVPTSKELEEQVEARTSELIKLNGELIKSEQRYHLMVDEVQDYAILFLNRQGIIENWNSGAEKIKRYKADEIIGKSFSNFYTEKDRKSGLPQKLLQLAVQQNRAAQEGWRVRKDNTVFWASVVITAVHNEKDEVIGFSKVTHDLTSKKESEEALISKKAELEEKNIELERMNKDLQAFAYVSSHDLQEPLRKIQTFASRITEKERHTLSEKGKYLFERMQLSAERMQALIEDLLTYSHTQYLKEDLKKTNLKDVIEQVKLDLNEELIEKNANIEIHNPFIINIIPFQFKQLFHNLLSNSIKFSRTGKPLRITIGNELVKGSDLKKLDLQDDKTYCHITYSDNGIGFDQHYSDKIFELFQRLHRKTEYPGTGIGLAIIKRIVENHKGAITAKSKLGEGATFNIYIPSENKSDKELQRMTLSYDFKSGK